MKAKQKLLSLITACATALSSMSVTTAVCFNSVSAEETNENILMEYEKKDRNGDNIFDYITITDCQDKSSTIEIPAEIEGLPVEVIGVCAFEKLTTLETVIIPDTVEKIERYAFYNCTLLDNVKVPDKYIYIADGAFSNTKLLKTSSSVYIGKMLYRCNSVVSGKYTIMEDVLGICDEAFYNEDITEVVLPEGLVGIGEKAFMYCSIEKLHIPESVKIIGEKAFYGNPIAEITVDKNNKHFCVKDNILYNTDYTKIELIAKNIESCEIPDTVTEIPENAFSYNSSLTDIKLPASLKSIGQNAFKMCENLKSITLPEGLEEIGDNAFEFSGLTEVTIPSSTKKLGLGAFGCCQALKKLVISDGTENLLSNKVELEICFDPGGAVNYTDYKGARFEYIESLYIPKTLKSIDVNFFSDSENLTDVYFDGTKSEYNVYVAPVYHIPYEDELYYTPVGNTYYENAAFHYLNDEPAVTTTTTSEITTATTTTTVTTVPEVSIITTETTLITISGYKVEQINLDISAENTIVDKSKETAYVCLSSPKDVLGTFTVYTPSGFKLARATNGNDIEYEIDENETSYSFKANTEMVCLEFEFDKSLSDGDYTIPMHFHSSETQGTNLYIINEDFKGIVTLQTNKETTVTTENNITTSSISISTITSDITKTPCGNGDGIVTTKVTATTNTDTSATTTTTTVTTTNTTVKPVVTGDADGDNELTVRDCAFIAAVIARGAIKELPLSADFNGDDVVNVRDAAAIARNLAKINTIT